MIPHAIGGAVVTGHGIYTYVYMCVYIDMVCTVYLCIRLLQATSADVLLKK